MLQNSQPDSGFILIVDDNPNNLSLLSEAIKSAGWRFRVAIDGESALTAVKYSLPDLILLDIQMPGLDGFEVCRHLKTNPETEAIPIIFTTALNDTESKAKAFELGAVDYLPKPFEQAEVLARVRVHLQLKQLTDSLEAQVRDRTIALQQQECFLRDIYQGVGAVICVIDVTENGDFRFSGWNRTAEQVTGIPISTIIGNTPEGVLGAVQGALQRQKFQRCLDTGETFTYEECLPFQGREMWWLSTLNPLKNHLGRIHRLILTTLDITDRKVAELEQQRLISIINTSRDFIGIATLEGQPIFLNKAGQELVGLESMPMALSIPISAYVASDDLVYLEQQILPQVFQNGSWQGEFRFRHFVTGEIIPVDYNVFLVRDDQTGEPLRLATITRDIRDRKATSAALQKRAEELAIALEELQRTQTHLIQSEKMSSLGQLVAGIAHEINNPVSFIHGNLTHVNAYTKNLLELIELYQQAESDSVTSEKIEAVDLNFIREDLPKLINSMQTGTTRIREIVRSLRTFSRLDEAEVKAVDIHEGLESTLMVVQHRLKADLVRPEITVIKHYGMLPLVECFAGQLNQVFMSIVVNAIDALEERDRSRSFTAIKQDPSTITISTSVNDQNDVVIRIADNGLGMPESSLKRLFDPFFTTKPVGRGTGMGLSISYQIISDRHRGKLYCHSMLGQGTEFTIEIPVRQLMS